MINAQKLPKSAVPHSAALFLPGALDGDDWEAALPETQPDEAADAGILDSQVSGAGGSTKGEGAASDCVMAYFGDHQVHRAPMSTTQERSSPLDLPECVRREGPCPSALACTCAMRTSGGVPCTC